MPVVTYGWKLSNNDSDVQSTNHFLWQTPSSPHNIKAHSIWRQESEHWCGFRGFRWWQSSRKCTQRWIRFKLNKFSLCELVQQNLKSWLETLTQRRVFETPVDSSSTHNWTAEHQRTTYFSQRYYQVNGTILICEDYEKYNSKSR